MNKIKIKGYFKPFTENDLAICIEKHHQGYDEIFISTKNLNLDDIEIIKLSIDGYTFISLDLIKGIDKYKIDKQFPFINMCEKARIYALNHNLYIEDLVKNQMNKARFEHTMQVAKLSKEIALANGLDGQKAYLMGLFHDVTKYMSKKDTMKIMNAYYPEHLNEPYAFYHQYTAVYWIDKNIGKVDDVIIRAIEHHTSGNDENHYSMILYVADKIEPSRGYDTIKEIDLAMKNIGEAFKTVKLQQKSYLKQRGVI